VFFETTKDSSGRDALHAKVGQTLRAPPGIKFSAVRAKLNPTTADCPGTGRDDRSSGHRMDIGVSSEGENPGPSNNRQS